MSLLKEPKPETFQYGFLTSRTARILRRPLDVAMDKESSRLLNQAKDFMDKILSGEALVSGEKSNLTPSLEALEVFRYGVEALTVMEQMQSIAQERVETRDSLRSFFEDIRTTINNVMVAPNNVDPAQVDIAARFFDIIADALLNEALESSHPEFALA